MSKHFKVLTECELVEQKQQSREVYYDLKIDKIKEVDRWLEQFRKIWEDRFNALDDILETLKNKKK